MYCLTWLSGRNRQFTGNSQAIRRAGTDDTESAAAVDSWPVRELQQYVAETADRLGLHATPATLLLDLQARVGALADEVVRATEHGRRPFRPTRDWEALLGDLAFAVVTLADQTGVETERAVRVAAETMYRSAMAQQRQQPAGDAWPFSG